MMFRCANAGHAERHAPANVGVVPVNCSGHLPPSFIDYVLSRRYAQGVVVAGCPENACYNRYGGEWTAQRLAGLRDPHLRARVPRNRLRVFWAGRLGRGAACEETSRSFAHDLSGMGP